LVIDAGLDHGDLLTKEVVLVGRAVAEQIIRPVPFCADMRFVFFTTLVMSPPPVLATWWGITYRGWGLMGCWTVITLWVCGLGLIYGARFLQGRWRHMRVIEPELLATDPPVLHEPAART
jgi:hypothetical protein